MKVSKYPGNFIAVEGIDGAGKTHVVQILKELFAQKYPDKEVIAIRAPGGNPISEMIRSILLTETSKMAASTELLLFMASHSETIDKVIMPALKRGAIVISDRFLDSTYAYQGSGRGLSMGVQTIHKYVLDEIRPDHTVFVTVSQEVAGARVHTRGDANHLDNESVEFKKRVESRLTFQRLTSPVQMVSELRNNGTLEELRETCSKFVERYNLDPEGRKSADFYDIS